MDGAISARTAGVVRALGWICTMGYLRPEASGQALEAISIVYNRKPNRVPTMFCDMIGAQSAA